MYKWPQAGLKSASVQCLPPLMEMSEPVPEGRRALAGASSANLLAAMMQELWWSPRRAMKLVDSSEVKIIVVFVAREMPMLHAKPA